MNPIVKQLVSGVKVIIYSFLLSPSLATYSYPLSDSLFIYLFLTTGKANTSKGKIHERTDKNNFVLMEYRRVDGFNIKHVLANCQPYQKPKI